MKFRIYPRRPVLRVIALIAYFLLSIQATYLVKPIVIGHAEKFFAQSSSYEESAYTFMGLWLAVFWVFVSFGFILEILQRKNRLDGDERRFEFYLWKFSIALTLMGMMKVGVAVFECGSVLELLVQEKQGVFLLCAGIAFASGVAFIRNYLPQR